MKKRILLLPIFLLLWLPFVASAQTVFSPQQLREDFALFRQALEEAHPGIYRYTSKEAFDAKFDSTLAMLQKPLSVQEFYVALNPLIVALRCGHTKFMPKGTYNYYFHSDKLFPLRLYLTPNKAFILGSYETALQAPAGAEVLAINGRPFPEIAQKLISNTSFADGLVQTSKYEELNRYFSGLYATFIEAAPRYAVTYRTAAGDTLTKELPATTLAAIQHYEKKQTEARPVQPPLRLFFTADQVAVLTIEGFSDSEQVKFKKFLKEAFATIQAKEARALVLDLRNNEGGTDKYGMLLASYLALAPFRYYQAVTTNTNQQFSFAGQAYPEPWYYGLLKKIMLKKNDKGTYNVMRDHYFDTIKPQKQAFTGDTYILTNGRSFSVTAEFAAVVHHMGVATFVGQETGGAYQGNNSGIFSVMALPNSRIELGIPLWAYYTAVPRVPVKDRGVIPNYQVAPSVQDVLSGTDRVMLYTQDLIRQTAASGKP